MTPERIVYTESFEESWYAGEAIDTVVLTEQGSQTLATTTVLSPSPEARDAVLKKWGMERGLSAGYDNLDTVLASMQERATITGRYRLRADIFEAKVASVRPEQWANPSPCVKWNAREVVGHIIDMHGVILRPLDRSLSPAPELARPIRSRRSGPPAPTSSRSWPIPSWPARSTTPPAVGRPSSSTSIRCPAPTWCCMAGTWPARPPRTTPSILTRSATPGPASPSLPPELLEQLQENARRVRAYGVEVFGPEVTVPGRRTLQDRLLGCIGRDPHWTAS